MKNFTITSSESDKKEPLILRGSEITEDPNQDLGPNFKNLSNSISSVKDLSIVELHTQFHILVLAFEDLIAGPIPLKDLVNGTRPFSLHDFQVIYTLAH